MTQVATREAAVPRADLPGGYAGQLLRVDAVGGGDAADLRPEVAAASATLQQFEKAALLQLPHVRAHHSLMHTSE